MLKNQVFSGAAYALGVPTGTSTVGPNPAANAQVRWNTTTNKLEFFSNTSGVGGWNAVATQGNVTISSFSPIGADGSKTRFWNPPVPFVSGDELKVIVHAGSVYQIPNTNYTFDGTGNIIFSSPPSSGATITIISGFASTVSNIA